MTTKDEALKQALDAMQQIHPDYHLMPGRIGPQAALLNLHTAIAACREALAQKDEQEPVAWALECPTQTGGTTWYLSWSRSGAGVCNRLRGECHEKPLYTAPPKRQPLTDEQRYALIKEHLGLDKRRDETVIDHRTGRWTDAARYFDLMDAAIETANGTGEQT